MTRAQRQWHLRLWLILGAVIMLGLLSGMCSRSTRQHLSLLPGSSVVGEGRIG